MTEDKVGLLFDPSSVFFRVFPCVPWTIAFLSSCILPLMRVAHFIHRYPPAVGGSEAYFARLSEWLAARGDEVVVFTTDADELSAFWDRSARRLPAGVEMRNGVEVRRCPLWHFPVGHRYDNAFIR
jgi:hypothetical protein